ncbi:hypothetical protein BGX29_005329, partial [Mortierella sp. GBA35]
MIPAEACQQPPQHLESNRDITEQNPILSFKEQNSNETQSSKFLPILSLLAAVSANSLASQDEASCDESTSSNGNSADGNAVQCDDLPSPEYLNLGTSNTENTSARPVNLLVPVAAVSRSTEESSIPSIALVTTHHRTPELIAMENGVDPSRLSLATTDDRRLDTPLLGLQEQGYASVMILPSAPVVEVENRHAQLLIAIKGPAIDDSEAMTELKKEGPLLPMSATLDRRYWQPSESVEDFEEGFDAPDDCNSFLTEGMGSEGADRSRNSVSRMDPTPEEETATTGSLSDQIDPEVKSSGQPPRRQVRFVAEVQIIPSSRTSSDDDDDLTLTNDSEDSDDDGDDDFQDSLNTTAKTILSEWESVEIVLSDKVLTSEEPASTKQECADNILTLASSLDPSTVPLPSSPIHEDVETFPSSPILRPSSATSAPLESPVLTPAALTTPSQQPTNPVVSVVTTGLTKTSAAATSNTATTDDCVSPRTLELISVRSQLNYWAETASLLRDQEQALTLHIDQLIQVMADVIEKCQEAEADLHEQKGLVQQLRQELDKVSI